MESPSTSPRQLQKHVITSLLSRPGASNKHQRKANASIRSRTIIDHKFRFNLSAIKFTTRTSRRQEKNVLFMKNKDSCKQRPAGEMKKKRQLRNSPSKALTYLRGFKSKKNRCGNSRDCSFRRDLLKRKKETEAQKMQHSAIAGYATCVLLIRWSLRSTHCHLKKTPPLSSPSNLSVPRRSLFSFNGRDDVRLQDKVHRPLLTGKNFGMSRVPMAKRRRQENDVIMTWCARIRMTSTETVPFRLG